jgi:hypothetical protein
MAYDEYLAERVRRMFAERHVLFDEKRMMGGLCFMVDGKMCIGVEKDHLMARIDPAVYDEALTKKGCAAMDFTGRPMRGFVFVIPEGLSSNADLAAWIDLALDFNPRAVASKKKQITPKRSATRAGRKSARSRKNG